MEDLIQLIALAIIFTLFIIFIALFFFFFYKKKKEQQEALLEQERLYSQTLLESQLEIQEHTLTNISQELHDNIGQTLSVAKLNLSTLKLENIEQSIEKIETAKNVINAALTSIRDLAKSMLGEKIAEIGLVQAIKNEIGIIENTGLYIVQLTESQNAAVPLSSQTELIAFRIVQETFHNTLKHAEATKIDVTFKSDNEATCIQIADNGKGFEPRNIDNATSGIGLANMKRRARLINADFEITSAPGQGTLTVLNIRH